MAETKKYTGKIDKVNVGANKKVGILMTSGDWYNSTEKTQAEMAGYAPGDTVTVTFFENDLGDRVFRNVVTIEDADATAIPESTGIPAKTKATENVRGDGIKIDPKYIVKIRDKEFVTFNGVLDAAHNHGLKSLIIQNMSVGIDSAHCQARAEFDNGSIFEAVGSSNKDNSKGNIAGAWFAELAQTRAFSRVLRIALNLDYVTKEELNE